MLSVGLEVHNGNSAWSEKKLPEKLTYMHNNPVKQGLVSQSGEWPWSSWRYYYLEDSSILAIDRMP